MRILFATTACLSLCSAAPTAFAQAQPQEVSQPTTNAATTGPGTPAGPGGKLICRPVVHEGMVMSNQQECHTQQQWDSVRQRNQQTVNQIQLNNLTTQPH